MRLQTLIQRANRTTECYIQKARKSPYDSRSASQRLSSDFGPIVNQLPPSLRIELLTPHLQQFPHRESLFANLNITGNLLLNIMANEYLGTRNVEIPPHIIAKFCDIRGVGLEGAGDGSEYLHQCIGAINLFCQKKECQEMIRERILGGTQGIANLFLDNLS